MYQFTGAEKLDVIADLADSFFEIMQDPEIVELAKKGESIVSTAIKKHKDAVLQMLARTATKEGVKPAEYLEQVGAFGIAVEFMQLVGSPEMAGLFNLQGQSADKTSSGSATVNTEVGAK